MAGRFAKSGLGGALFLLLACASAAGVYFAFFAPRGQDPSGGDPPPNLVRAEFLANAASVAPEREFLVGVHFRIAPDWYIYHENPGDAGLPTTVELKLPEGFTAGEILYPAPARFLQPGDITGYGYREEVMLLARVTPPAGLKPGGLASLQAHVRWLACRNICILGEQRLELRLPVETESRPGSEEVFSEWLDRMPGKLTGLSQTQH